MSSPAPRSWSRTVAALRRASVATPWLAAIVVLGLGWLGRGYTADDAFITGRYAMRLAQGHGYTFRDGPATDGVTGPLLLAIEAPAASLGFDPVEASKLVGALAVALAAWLVVSRLRARSGGTLASWLAVVALAVSGPLSVHAQSGLETGVATLVVTVAVLGATARPRVSWAGVISALVLVPWLRPELVPVSWLIGGIAGWRASTLASTTRARATAAWITAAIVGLASVVAFRLALFGDAIPLSAQAKPTDLGNGLGYALAGLSVVFGLMLVPAVHAVRTGRLEGAVALVLVACTACVILGGGDWMPGARLLVPIAPTGIALYALGAARFARQRRGAAILALSLLVLLPQAVLTTLILEQADDVARSREGAGQELRESLARDARVVALVDIGFLTYGGSFDPFDLAGVTDPSIGSRPGGHCAKAVTLDDLLARDVDTLVLHSGIEPRVEAGRLRALRAHPVEQALAADPRTAELFEVTAVVRYAARYWYVVLRRRT